MSDAEQEWLLAEWLRAVRARWVVAGVPAKDRADLLRHLIRDLAAARTGGAKVEDLTSTPPHVFADASAAGLASSSRPITVSELMATCLLPGLAAAAAAWALLLVLSQVLVLPAWADGGGVYLFIDLAVIAAVLAVMVGAVRWRFRAKVGTAALTPRLAVALTAATLLGFAMASAYGATQGYSLSTSVIAVEVMIVLTCLAAAIVVAQRWTRVEDRGR